MKRYKVDKDFDCSKLDYPSVKKAAVKQPVVTLPSGCKVYFLKYWRKPIVY